MEHRFDSLARSVSGPVSRRDVFWRLGSGLALAALGMFGLGASRQQPCEQICALNCINLHPHHSGAARGECIRECVSLCHAG